MATIRENRKNGKVVSYRFVVCLERDARGKQVRKYTTWTAPADLTPTKAKRVAERAAAEWEDEIRKEHQEQKEAAANGRAYSLPPEKRQDDFAAFVNDTWLPLQVQNGNCKARVAARAVRDFTPKSQKSYGVKQGRFSNTFSRNDPVSSCNR